MSLQKATSTCDRSILVATVGLEPKRQTQVMKAVIVFMILLNFAMILSLVRTEEEVEDGADMPHSRRRILLEKDISMNSLDFDGASSFSSCLVVPEEGLAKLPEWLAYHYYTMNLRYLVIYLPDQAPDTDGLATTELLQKWKLMMKVVSWTTPTLDAKTAAVTTATGLANEDNATLFRRREASFYHHCAIHMQNNNRGLVGFQRVNEYAAINQEAITNAPSLITKPGSVLRLLQYARTKNVADSTCVTTYKTQFSAVGSKVEEIKAATPESLQGHDLDTVRWQWQQKSRKPQRGKAIVDVSAISNLQATSKQRVDYTFAPYCPRTLSRSHAVIRMHVYPLSSDNEVPSLSDPADPIVPKQQQLVLNTEVTPWVRAFVDYVGPETAVLLLESIGPSNLSQAS
jgi:hypothetical protein